MLSKGRQHPKNGKGRMFGTETEVLPGIPKICQAVLPDLTGGGWRRAKEQQRLDLATNMKDGG